MRSFYDSLVRKLDSLQAWNTGRVVARRAYGLTLNEPLSKHFGLSDQIRRASISIPANIAEGYALGTTPQFIKHLQIALGSSTELATHLELVRDFEFASSPDVDEALTLANKEIGLLIGLVYTLKRRSR